MPTASSEEPMPSLSDPALWSALAPGAVLLLLLLRERRSGNRARAQLQSRDSAAHEREQELRYFAQHRITALRDALLVGPTAVPGLQNDALVGTDFAASLDMVLGTVAEVGSWARNLVEEARQRAWTQVQDAQRQAGAQVQEVHQKAAGHVEQLRQQMQQEVEAVRQQAEAEPERVEAAAFLFIARRLHALVSRTLAALSAVENEIADPDLLNDLFKIDHLVTQSRRAVENLGVLGGENPRRVRRPLLVFTVLRSAVSEIEHYVRVRVKLPAEEVYLPGHAAPDIIRLVAELVENATKFSPPGTRVEVRTERVAAGMVIEIEDRGLAMSPQKLATLNQLLAAPRRQDVRQQLLLGQLGMLVTGSLAARHGVHVELRANLLGGTQALIVLPTALLEPAPQRTRHQPVPELAPAAVPAAALAMPSAGAVLDEAAQVAFPGRAVVLSTVQPRSADTSTSLPQRRSRAVVPEPLPSAAPQVPADSSAGEGKPALPQRHAGPVAAPVVKRDAARSDSPGGPATGGLMGQYTAGARRARHDAADAQAVEPPPA
jgi:signal transduction histidine kinase